MKIRAVIFDFDGTLVRFFGKAFIVTLAKMRKLPLPKDFDRKFKENYTKTGYSLLKELWPEEDAKAFFSLWDKEDQKNLKIFPKTKSVLRFLKKRSTILGIITQRRERSLMPLIQNYDILKYFQLELMVTCGDLEFQKPNPKVFDSILKNLSAQNISKNEILYVGDSIIDWHCAKDADVAFVAVVTGQEKRKNFTKEGVDKENILNSIADLPKWIKKHT